MVECMLSFDASPFSPLYSSWIQDLRTLEIVKDYFRFVTTFFEVIDTSAPHIYHSALPLSPRSSIVRGSYEQYARPLVRVVRGLPDSWEPVVATKYHCNRIWREASSDTAAWSPCSRFIAIQRAGVFQVLDAITFKTLKILESRNSSFDHLCFSPDGRTLIGVYGDGQVTSWDLQTGGEVYTITVGLQVTREGYHQGGFSSTFSADGKTIAIASHDWSWTDTHITTYDPLAEKKTSVPFRVKGRIIHPIWTHCGCLRFASMESECIVVWEAAFTSTHAPAIVASFPVPQEVRREPARLLLPNPFRAAFSLGTDGVFVWDFDRSKLLLNSLDTLPQFGFKSYSFSSDGRFFACATWNWSGVCIWKESPVGYSLHQQFTVVTAGIYPPLFSPNGESFTIPTHSTTQLRHTNDQVLLPRTRSVREFTVVEFSLDETLVAFTHRLENIVVVVEIPSGSQRLVLDTGIHFNTLGITGSIIVAIGGGKMITWKIPTACSALGPVRANVGDSVQSLTLDLSLDDMRCLKLSSDLTRVTIHSAEKHYYLDIHDASTGTGRIARAETSILDPKFSPDGRETEPCFVSPLCTGERENDLKYHPCKGWEIVEDSDTSGVKLVPLEEEETVLLLGVPEEGTVPPPNTPRGSPCGNKITGDEWVLSPTQQRVLFLPHHLRIPEPSMIRSRSGRYLVLGDDEPREIIILSFFE